jgi:hypothetical protein
MPCRLLQPGTRRGLAQQSPHSRGQQGFSRGKTNGTWRVPSGQEPPTGKLDKTFGVVQPTIHAILHDCLVAGQFPLLTHAPVGKPNRRVEENESASESCQTIPHIVAAPNVDELVSQNVSKLATVQVRNQLSGQDNARPPPASSCRRTQVTEQD